MQNSSSQNPETSSLDCQETLFYDKDNILNKLCEISEAKFNMARKNAKFYQRVQNSFIPKLETEQRQYICNRCFPSRIYSTKQEYAGHCKKHRYQSSVKTGKERKTVKEVKEEESEEIFKCVNGVIDVL